MTEINATNFTRADFMTPTTVAKKLNVDADTVVKTMRAQFHKGTQILIGESRRSRKTPLVYKMTHIGGSISDPKHSPLRLHPLGLDAFKEILAKGEEK